MYIAKDVVADVLSPIVGDELRTYEHHGQLSVIVERDELIEVLIQMRDHPLTRFDQLLDVTAIDWLDRKPIRFEVVYFLYSIPHKHRLRVKVPVPERDARVPTATTVWESANWYERETYDMYGIRFEGHPDLRRFYMPEDYVHPETGEPLYPLRKDYPLMGIPGAAPLPEFPERELWLQRRKEYLEKYPPNPLDTSYTFPPEDKS